MTNTPDRGRGREVKRGRDEVLVEGMADSEDADKVTRTLILCAYVQFQASNLARSRP